MCIDSAVNPDVIDVHGSIQWVEPAFRRVYFTDCDTLLVVIIMSISALRLHRGLVDSAVVNRRCHMVVEADGAIKRLAAVSVNSDIQIEIPIAK
jgi:hypothetical protein